MPLRIGSKKPRKRPVKEIFRREKQCERCGRKIKMGRYCYWCGKYQGLW